MDNVIYSSTSCFSEVDDLLDTLIKFYEIHLDNVDYSFFTLQYQDKLSDSISSHYII